MSDLKPLLMHIHGPSPNPWKVVIFLEELKLPYKLVKIEDVKGEKFLALNPNGRAPALEDPNTGITTWESGSCIDYLIETYDKTNELSYTSPKERAEQRNWAHFQMSGQGPYFGQKAWFSRYHPEKIQSAVDRYDKEIRRVLSVIDLHLGRTGRPYLVGNKCTYADLMWIPWNGMLSMLMGEGFDEEWKNTYPKSYEWNQKLLAREGVKKMQEARKPIMEAFLASLASH